MHTHKYKKNQNFSTSELAFKNNGLACNLCSNYHIGIRVLAFLTRNLYLTVTLSFFFPFVTSECVSHTECTIRMKYMKVLVNEIIFVYARDKRNQTKTL